MIIGRIASMLQGMTQQAPKLRLPTQGELAVNSVPSAVYGLGKRNGTDHVALLSNRRISNGFVHAIVRGDERYVVYFDGRDLVVYGLNGTRYPVQADIASLQYLACTDLRRDLRAITLADSTVLLNRTKVVRMSDDLSLPLTNVAVVTVKRGNYAQKYTVKVNGTDYSFTVSDTLVAETSTSFIAAKLADSSHLGGAAGFTVTYRTGDSVLTIRSNSGGDFDIEVQDSAAGSLLSVCKHRVATFADLPPLAPQDYLAKVYGSLEEDTDDYWVQFDADRVNGANRPLAARRGSWVEALAPETPYRLDETTMPQELVRLQDDESGTVTGLAYSTYFRLRAIEWEDRTVGDTESNKDPSFVGHTIGSLFLYKDRLGFLSRGQVVLSRAGDYFNFWRSATLQVIDNDPIDISVPTGDAIDFDHAIPFSEELLLVGPRAQMVLTSQDALTPATVRTNPATELEIDTGAVPAPVDSSVFLATWSGRYSKVTEYYVSGVNRLKRGVDAAAQVPKFMLGRVSHMSVSPLYKSLAVATGGRSSWLYVYHWLDGDNNQRVQSAWGFWTFEDPILWVEFIGQDLWMIVARPEGPCLERLRLDPNRKPDGAPQAVLLDRLLAAGPVGTIAESPLVAGVGEVDPGLALIADEAGGGSEGPLTPGTGTDLPGDVATPGGGDPDPGGGTDPGGSPPGGGVGGEDPPIAPGDPNPSTDVGPAISVTYDPIDDCTTLTLPWRPNTRTRVVRGSDMKSLSWTLTGDYTLCLRGNFLGTRLFIGNYYTFRYRFSPAALFQTSQYGQSQTPLSGRITVASWCVDYADAGPFDFEVFRDGVFAKRKVIVQRRLSGPMNEAPRTGEASVLVQRNADYCRVDLVNPYPTQAWFTSARWEGSFNPKGQSV